MADITQPKQLTPSGRMKSIISSASIQDMLQSTLKDKAQLFAASILELYGSDSQLQKCDPALVVQEALKAASLDLPLNKNLGFAWIIARWNSKERAFIPKFQPGWRGFVQLAQRTSQYEVINTGKVYDGELLKHDKLTGVLNINGVAKSDKIIGYFAHIELINGFKKSLFWSKEKVVNHAIQYNPECKKEGKLVGNWLENFDKRAEATVLKHLIKNYGIMSVEMQGVLSALDETTPEEAASNEINANANMQPISFTDATDGVIVPEGVNQVTGEVRYEAELLKGGNCPF